MRIDLIFSFWIFFWFLLYFFNYVSYSPKCAIIISIIHNVLLVCLMIRAKVNIIYILVFMLVILIFKALPLYIVRHDAIVTKDVILTLFIFNIYLAWLIVNGNNFYSNQIQVINMMTKDSTFLDLMKQLQNAFK